MGYDMMDALCPRLVDGVMTIHADQIGHCITCSLYGWVITEIANDINVVSTQSCSVDIK